ncbi:hypothetical protein OG870_17460 [Streptomyces sp. NBC_00461]|uniref:hypothetical protein n=1 Tax=Streptomyces sp. NBC_00461 TaxID=2975750 RepID=UPI002E18EF58
MNEEQAIEAAKQIGLNIGEHVIIQNDGQITHPHTSDSSDFRHVDGWRVERTGEDEYEAEKVHGPA